MRLTARIQGGERAIEKEILTATKDALKGALETIGASLQMRLRQYIYDRITTSPEYASISFGKLRDEFGLPDGQARLNKIIRIWANSVVVRVSPIRMSGGRLNGTVVVTMIQSNYGDVLSAPEATLMTQTGPLNWLDWLLNRGSQVIIRDYSVSHNPKAKSRTGRATMQKTPGKNWTVPPEFAGTPENNFLTRALSDIDSFIDKAIRQEVSFVFK